MGTPHGVYGSALRPDGLAAGYFEQGWRTTKKDTRRKLPVVPLDGENCLGLNRHHPSYLGNARASFRAQSRPPIN